MARMIRISMPVSERMYKAAKLDCEEGLKNAKTENDKAWWKKLQSRIERRWNKHNGTTVIRVGSLKATPAPKPSQKKRSTKLATKKISKAETRTEIAKLSAVPNDEQPTA